MISKMASLCFSRLFSSQANTLKVGIVGVPCNKGTLQLGVELAPAAIRDGGLIQNIMDFNENVNVKDYGDVLQSNASAESVEKLPKNMLNYVGFADTMHRLSNKVCEVRDEDRICLTLGGDHSIAIGSICGHLRYNQKTSVLWIDAHSDINTNLISKSGNIHGMPVAILAKELESYWSRLPGFEWQKEKLSLKNLAYIGLRSIDPMERLIAKKFNVNQYGMKEIDKYGIHKCIEMAMDAIDSQGDRDYHISFDVDALDRYEAPSTIIPLPGGLTIREGITIIEEVFQTNRLKGMDLVEVNPTLGNARDVKRTIDAATHLLKAACGTERSGNLPLKNLELPKPSSE